MPACPSLPQGNCGCSVTMKDRQSRPSRAAFWSRCCSTLLALLPWESYARVVGPLEVTLHIAIAMAYDKVSANTGSWSQNVTKNLTGHRMHVAVPQICQINCRNVSFQNMYAMLKATIDRLARKINFVQKILTHSGFRKYSRFGCLEPFYYSMTTLKLGGFWESTRSLSWNLVLW